MTCLRTERIEDSETFARLSEDWWDLWHRIPGSTPFQSPGWLMPWWRAFHPGLLNVITVRRSGVLMAVAPLYLEQSTHRLLPIGISVSDELDLLIDPSSEEEAGAELVRFVGEQAKHGEAICFEELAPNAAALRLVFDGQWTRELMPQSVQTTLALPRHVDELRRYLPAKKLRNLQVARRRMGDAAEVVTIGPRQIEDCLQELFRLHGLLWNSRGGPGVLGDAAVRSFHMQAVPQLMEAGLVRLYALRAGYSTVGIYYGFLYHSRSCTYLAGYDPAFAWTSPGTVLLGHAIEQAIIEGATEFSFLRGREEYKYQWGAVERWNTRMELRRR